MLTSFAFHTIPERAEYLARAIRKRYAKELKLPLWTDEELEDMGTSQARYIRDKQREKEEVLERISHCEMIALTEMTIEDYWERFPKLADLADNGLIYGVLPMLPVE